MKIQTQILNGALHMPAIVDLASTDTHAYKQIESMFEAMWFAYLSRGTKGTINLPYWAKRIKNPKSMNIALKVLSHAGWITVSTQPHRNWSEAKLNEDKLLNYVDEETLASVRMSNKFKQYMLTNTESTSANLTKINGRVKDTGLYRPGFAHAGNTPFQFDIEYMLDYKPSVIKLVNKGIEKMLVDYPSILDDHVNYRNIGREIVDAYIALDGTYTSGSRVSDSRGRDIAGYLNKIGNPVGFKIMRALLVIPFHKRQHATEEGENNKFLFIAELNGFKNGTKAEKIAFGMQCYSDRTLPSYNLSSKLDELPDAIWCMRTYDDLDAYYVNPNHRWLCPIEIDMSASVIGFYATLLNDKRGMDRVNMIGDTLGDAWRNDTIKNRNQCKTIMR